MTLTREGKRFLLAAVLIAVAAVNTGNNLIYLILSLMLSFIVISYLILRLNLARLVLEVSAAGPIFAQESANVELHVHNNKKIPAFSLIITAQYSEEQIYCEEVPGHGVFRSRIKMVFSRRGLYGYSDFIVQSGFPFILLRKSMSVPLSGQVLVYPKLLDASSMSEIREGIQETGALAVRGRGDEVYSLRAFQYGDDWRRIHWKASARQDGFLVREYAVYASQQITILLDNLYPFDAVHFETAVSLAATLANQYIERGYSVRLITGGKTIPYGSGKDQLVAILHLLALISEEQKNPDLAGFATEGFLVAILKSAESCLKAEAASADLVIYADTL